MQIGVKIGIGDRTHHSGLKPRCSTTQTYFELNFLFRPIFFPKRNATATGKGKEHTGDSERLEMDTRRRMVGKEELKTPKNSLMKVLVKE